MSSGNFKDLTPDDNYASVDLTGDSIVLPPDAEDVILVVEGDSSISGTVNVELEHSNDNVNFTTAKNKPVGAGAAASYSLSSFSQVAEGGSITVNLSTTGVDEGVLIPYTITGIQAADLTSGSLTGTMEIGATGNASLTLQPVEDLVAESETMTVTIGSSGNPLDSIDIDILDTSYSITPVATSMDEDSILVFNVSATNVANGTTLYWTINHGTSATADFVAESGSFTVTNNLGSFSVQTTADLRTEGSETFTTEVRLGSISGTVAATSSTITINDTSVPTAPAAFSNEYALSSQATTSTVTDFRLNGTEKSLFPSLGSGANTFPDYSDAWSLSFWLYVPTATRTNSYRNCLIKQQVGTAQGGIQVFMRGSPEIEMYITSTTAGTFRSIGSSSLTFDAWNHVIFTYNGSGSLNLYVNDGSSGSSSGTYPTAINNATINALEFHTYVHTPAGGSTIARASNVSILDEVMGFNIELSSAQRTELYNAGIQIDPSNLSFASNIDSHFRMGDGANDDVANNQVYDEKDSSRYIEKVGTGTHAITQLTSSDAPYVAPPPSGFTNEYYVSDQYRGSVTGSDLTGNYYRDSSTDKIGFFPDLDLGTDFRNSNTVSYSFWYQRPVSGTENTFSDIFSEKYDNAGPNGQSVFHSYIYGDRLVIYTTYNNTDNQKEYTIPNDDNWHHITITTNSDDVVTGANLYIDGSLATPVFSDTSNTIIRTGHSVHTLTLGGASSQRDLASGTVTFNLPTGNFIMDEFSTWKKQLSASEVSSLWNSGTPGDLSQHSASSDLQRWFRFGDTSGDGTSIKDSLNTSVQFVSYDSQDNTTQYPLPFSNTKAIESPAEWTLTGGDVNGNTMPTGRIGAYQNTDSTKHLFGGANANGNFSVSLWYNQTATPNGGHMLLESVIINNSNTTGSVKWGLMAYTNDQFYIHRAGVVYDANYYGSAISDNVWRHVVVTIQSVSGTQYTEGVYIDGVNAGGTTNLLKSGIPYLFDMTGYTNYGFSTGGVFDTDANHTPFSNAINSNDMRVDSISTYNKKLSASEVTAIYNNGVPTDLTGHSGLVHWFRMGDGATDTGTSIVSQTDSSVAMTSTTDYSLTLTSSDTIYVP